MKDPTAPLAELVYEKTVQAFMETCPDHGDTPKEGDPFALPSENFEERVEKWKHTLFAAWGLEDDPQMDDWYQLGIDSFGDPCWSTVNREEFICFMIRVVGLLSERK
jgi:hypothetical protein